MYVGGPLGENFWCTPCYSRDSHICESSFSVAAAGDDESMGLGSGQLADLEECCKLEKVDLGWPADWPCRHALGRRGWSLEVLARDGSA